MLSGAGAARSDAPAQSKHPYPHTHASVEGSVSNGRPKPSSQVARVCPRQGCFGFEHPPLCEGCSTLSMTERGCNKSSRPTVPCDGPRMNPSVDVGNPPRPFRHLRMTERRTPDPSSSRVPVHSALVQKSVTVITNPAGRLSIWMLGKTLALGKWKTANSWQVVCNQSNARFTNGPPATTHEGIPKRNKLSEGCSASPRRWPIRRPRTTEGLDSTDQL